MHGKYVYIGRKERCIKDHQRVVLHVCVYIRVYILYYTYIEIEKLVFI